MQRLEKRVTIACLVGFAVGAASIVAVVKNTREIFSQYNWAVYAEHDFQFIVNGESDHDFFGKPQHPIQQQFSDLECAFLAIEGYYMGCVSNNYVLFNPEGKLHGLGIQDPAQVATFHRDFCTRKDDGFYLKRE